MKQDQIPARAGPILCVVGARPNYMKMAPIIKAFESRNDLPKALMVHTGQHYDEAMNNQLFRGLNLPKPDFNLNVGSATHAVQTAEVMRRFEPVLDDVRPSCVVVVGDVNSTIACALVASKKLVPVIHVEAGLRSYDRQMPEEINRVLTDQLSDVLYTTERSAAANLEREGIPSNRIEFVGNVMIDSLLSNLPSAVSTQTTLEAAGLGSKAAAFAKNYAVLTLHRPSNVDNEQRLGDLLATLTEISRELPLICPLHPRTHANLKKFGLEAFTQLDAVAILPPQGYLEMLGLLSKARVVLTDSGGIQEETTAMGVPCLTLRENTERPITCEQGTNTIVGCARDDIFRAFQNVMHTGGKAGRVPEYWDGKAAQRIAQHLARWLLVTQ